MRKIKLALACSVLVTACGPGLVPAHSAPLAVGDYAAAPRLAGHIDVDRLLQRLIDMKANTYMWLVWHSAYDWSDLQYFLPKAQQAGINVWVYLVPHSETPLNGFREYSEPYRLDYVRWAQEIASLSLTYPNLKGYVIDDFWDNMIPDRFTDAYIDEMVAAGKAINPTIKFYPLLYFHDVDERVVDRLLGRVDGAVLAYPPNRGEILNAKTYFNDSYQLPASMEIASSWGSYSVGQRGRVSQQVTVTDPVNAKVTFSYWDNYNLFQTGRKFLQVLVDGQPVWREDVAGLDRGQVTVNVSQWVAGKSKATLSFEVADAYSGDAFALRTRFSNLSATGLTLASNDFSASTGWTREAIGKYYFQPVNARQGANAFNKPFLVMPAADPAEFTKRYNQAATPEAIAAVVDMATAAATDGYGNGVVTYCMEKAEGSDVLDRVAEIYGAVPATLR
ncbi:hypothetical protein [Jeongeupia chitinilytica]|nr:hypothetical protein [Jeongeupia chitinilytica]